MTIALEEIQPDDWDILRRNQEVTKKNLRQPLPNARVTHNVDQAIANNTRTPVAFNTDVYNVGAMHSVSVSNTRMTAKITGLYSMDTCIMFAASAVGTRTLEFRLNGVSFIAIANMNAIAGNDSILALHSEVRLTAGDFVEVTVVQTSGGALNVRVGAGFAPVFAIHRISGYTNEGIA